MKNLRTIGPGWDHLGGAVYERDHILRIHTDGLVTLEDGTVISGTTWPESKARDWCIAIHGGNVRRGTMAWAMWCERKQCSANEVNYEERN